MSNSKWLAPLSLFIFALGIRLAFACNDFYVCAPNDPWRHTVDTGNFTNIYLYPKPGAMTWDQYTAQSLKQTSGSPVMTVQAIDKLVRTLTQDTSYFFPATQYHRINWTESNSNDITKTSFRGVPPGNPTSKSRSPGDNGNGATFTNVAPNTIYAFSARNCDEFTCTDWSKVVDFNSGPATPSGVQLVLQGAKSFPMGSATVGPNRSFSTRIRVDKTVPPGKYTLVAERGGADEASAPLTVVTSGQLTPTIQFVDQVTGTT
jgi:hypothetical protein